MRRTRLVCAVCHRLVAVTALGNLHPHRKTPPLAWLPFVASWCNGAQRLVAIGGAR